jgi:hypothetical protein
MLYGKDLFKIFKFELISIENAEIEVWFGVYLPNT